MQNPLNWLYAGIVAAILWFVYDTIYDRGYGAAIEETQKKVDSITAERDNAVAVKDAYVSAYEQWREDLLKATAREVEAHRERVAAMEAALEAERNNVKYKETLVHEIREVLPEDIGNMRLSVGLVSLWNQSLEGRAADAGVLRATLAEGGPGADGELSEATLFELLEAGLRNNAEAVQREVKLGLWRAYHATNEKRFAEHERQAMAEK